MPELRGFYARSGTVGLCAAGSGRWPALSTVQDAEHQHGGPLDPVDHDVGRSDDDEFPGGGDAARTSDRWMIGEPCHGRMDGVTDVECRPGITLSDPLELCGQVAGGLGEPLDPHAGRPVACRSMAARCCCQLERTDS